MLQVLVLASPFRKPARLVNLGFDLSMRARGELRAHTRRRLSALALHGWSFARHVDSDWGRDVTFFGIQKVFSGHGAVRVGLALCEHAMALVGKRFRDEGTT